MYHQQYLHLQAKPTNVELAFKDHFHHLKIREMTKQRCSFSKYTGLHQLSRGSSYPIQGTKRSKNCRDAHGWIDYA